MLDINQVISRLDSYREKILDRAIAKLDAWNESDHPRESDGKFGSGGGGGGGGRNGGGNGGGSSASSASPHSSARNRAESLSGLVRKQSITPDGIKHQVAEIRSSITEYASQEKTKKYLPKELHKKVLDHLKRLEFLATNGTPDAIFGEAKDLWENITRLGEAVAKARRHAEKT